VPLRAIRIGHLQGDYRDPRCTWLRQREIGPRGALLVRPDRFVAWRSAEGALDPVGELHSALETILCRPQA
jgi:2,4-dichlorophenol 6-monooxygenase